MARPDVAMHVVHLDHQTRAGASAEDAAFVAGLAERFLVPCTVARLEEIEPGLVKAPANISSRYRAVRQELFRRVVKENDLSGVLLAHHADDQAETVLLRLIRGSSPAGLVGMARETRIGELRVLRPLLGVGAEQLREYLRGTKQDWREDLSNASTEYLRNLLRPMIRRDAGLRAGLIALAEACRKYRGWVRGAAPELGAEFGVGVLREVPGVLAREAARRWLTEAGSPPGKLAEEVLDRLVQMASDAATAARQEFPGRVRVRRRGRGIFVEGKDGGADG
jgi:tRNA(Ile)-lysidine synthetase-like protein